MAFKLPKLPFSKDGIKGFISAETLNYHHGKHHQTYITKLNENLEKPDSKEWAGKSLHDIVKGCKKPAIFNNAAQHWNHTFYWYCISPNPTQPSAELKALLEKKWGTV